MKAERRHIHQARGAVVVLILLGVCLSPAAAVERIVTIGDSWAYLVADYGSVQLMLNTFFPGQGYTVANESFGGGTAAQMATMLDQITAKINAHPTADVVWLSAGGNDMLLGLAAGGWYLGMPNESGLFDTIGSNVQVVANHILSLRPDIQVVIMSYDYPNFWDFDLSDGGQAQVLRANYALGLNGTGWIGSYAALWFPQQQAVNAAFRGMEQRKVNIGAGSRRIHHVWNYAVNDYGAGYSGYFGNWPAGYIWDDLPVTKGRLGGSGGTDPIHLNTTGYNTIALNAYNNFFSTAFQPASLSLNANRISFGNVRIGTSANGSVTASNAGPNFTKVRNLTFPTASGDFSGSSQAFNPLFKDPTLGSDTASKTYTYTPINRGTDSQVLTITSDSGNPSLTLTGTGVGPLFAANPGSLDFGVVEAGTIKDLGLAVSNNTPDPELGNPTNLTLLSYQITGTAAAEFSLGGFSPGTVLAKGQSVNLSVGFAPAGPPGAKTAALTFYTDQAATFGGAGQSFSIPLSGNSVQYYGLTLTLSNPNWGSVDVEPAPADPNSPRYPAGTQVTLTAQPIEGKSFRQWEVYNPGFPGDSNYAIIDDNNPLTIVMDQDKQIGAFFKCGGSGVGLALPLVMAAGILAVSARTSWRRKPSKR